MSGRWARSGRRDLSRSKVNKRAPGAGAVRGRSRSSCRNLVRARVSCRREFHSAVGTQEQPGCRAVGALGEQGWACSPVLA